MKKILIAALMAAAMTTMIQAHKVDRECKGKVDRFIPFSHDFGDGAWTQEDYDAVAVQKVVHIGDCVRYKGKKYVSLRNHSTYPNLVNEQGNPFYVISNEAYAGGSYFRQKSNELSCTEEVTFVNMPEINDKHVWAVGWYQMEISQTENCSGYGTLAPYYRTGQIGTALYGSVNPGNGWKFVYNGKLFAATYRDYVIVPTPGSAEDKDFWKQIKRNVKRRKY